MLKKIYILFILLSFSNCSIQNEDTIEQKHPKVEKDTVKIKRLLDAESVVFDENSRKYIQGLWSYDSNDGATFKIFRDSIDFFEYDPPKKYNYQLDSGYLKIYYDYGIKKMQILKLTNDTLSLVWIDTPNIYTKIR